MRIVAFDIETIPTEGGLARLIEKKGAEIKAPGNYKKQELIDAYIAEKRADLEASCTKEASLSPLYGQVAAVSMWDGREGGALTLHTEGSEIEILFAAAEALQDTDLLVTFNGFDFDCPFTSLRMLVHKITPPAVLYGQRYRLHPHCDLRKALGGWQEFVKGGLADYCAALGVPCPDKDMGLTGADVARLVREERWEELQDYSFGGAISTWNLLEAVWPALRCQLPGCQGLSLAEVAGLDSAEQQAEQPGLQAAPQPAPSAASAAA